MNPTKAIKRARNAIRQADNALKAADRSLRKQAKNPEGEKPNFPTEPPNMPADMCGCNGLAAAAAMLRQQGPHAFKIGDEIETKHRLGKLRFVVIGVDHDKSAEHDHTLTLLLTSIVLGSAFDTPSLDAPFGRNTWHMSSIRDMLNDGFLDGFTDTDRQAMASTQRRTYSFAEREYIHTQDKVFLLSASEAGFEVNGETIMDEGDAYPYFTSGRESRQLCDASGSARSWWLRSPSPWDGYGVRLVSPSGALSYSIAGYGNAVAAVCVIG